MPPIDLHAIVSEAQVGYLAAFMLGACLGAVLGLRLILIALVAVAGFLATADYIDLSPTRHSFNHLNNQAQDFAQGFVATVSDQNSASLTSFPASEAGLLAALGIATLTALRIRAVALAVVVGVATLLLFGFV